jgi:hypothetical protein
VLNALSRTNPWSVHINEPKTIPVSQKTLSKGASIEQVLEQYILTLYRKAFAAEMRVKPRARKPSRVRRTAGVLPIAASPIEAPPPWMLPTRHWHDHALVPDPGSRLFPLADSNSPGAKDCHSASRPADIA